MEFGALNISGIERTCVENMTCTYSRLAAATPGSEPLLNRPFTGYSGPFPHAVGNFVALTGVTYDIVAELRELTLSNPHLLIYAPFPAASTEVEQLRRANFEVVTSYILMVSLGAESKATESIGQAVTIGERHKAVEFMADQSFTKSSRSTKEQMIASTTLSHETDLHTVSLDREIIAACMISRSPMCVGLYNLCVKSANRNRGIGTSMTRFALDIAKREGAVLTLQCSRAVAPFYHRLGMQSVGFVQVMSNFSPEPL